MSELPWEQYFFVTVTVTVFPVELLAYQVSMIGACKLTKIAPFNIYLIILYYWVECINVNRNLCRYLHTVNSVLILSSTSM